MDMKRFASAALAAAMFAASVGAATPAAAHNRNDRGWDRHDRDDDDRNDRRRYRDGRRHDQWDRRHHNGYWHDGRWYYGPPRYFNDGYRYDYRAWRRGDRLPPYYRDQYRVVDWRRHHLRPPPRGCHYVYDYDREEYILVGIATGVILGVILAGN
jgi:Ni/Co efflux regulator RcnB